MFEWEKLDDATREMITVASKAVNMELVKVSNRIFSEEIKGRLFTGAKDKPLTVRWSPSA